MIERVLSGLSAEDVGPRCLVTGGGGFLGAALSEALLALGCTVVSLDLRAGHAVPGAQEIVGDIRDRAAVDRAVVGVDVVFHTAAVVSLVGIAPPAERQRVWSINAEGTDVVIAASRAAGVRRLVYTSTANVVIDRVIDEEDESAPYAERFVDLYGPSKIAAEKAALSAEGLATIALRPGGLWGAGGLMIEAFLEQLAAGRFVALISDGSAVVDNTHVLSLVRAELLAAAALSARPEVVSGRAYFITDDERINGLEWFRPIAEGLGHTFPTRRLPGGLMYAVAWLSEILYRLAGVVPTLTRIGVLKLTRSSAVRIDAARSDLGYAPLLTRDQGVALHMAAYRERVRQLQEDT